MWSGYLQKETVQRIVVDNLLNMQLLPYLNKLNDQQKLVDITESIILSFPRSWTQTPDLLQRAGLFRFFLFNSLTKKLENNKTLLRKGIEFFGQLQEKETEKQLLIKYHLQ